MGIIINHDIRIPVLNNQDSTESKAVFFFVAQVCFIFLQEFAESLTLSGSHLTNKNLPKINHQGAGRIWVSGILGGSGPMTWIRGE